MGSSLAPVLANLFLGHHKKVWLEQYEGPSINLYRRYVDDTFFLLNNDQDAVTFFFKMSTVNTPTSSLPWSGRLIKNYSS